MEPSLAEPLLVVAAALLGVAAGFLSGLLGVGGGILMTPALHYGFGVSWGTAVLASLGAILIQSPLGLWRHHQKGAVDVRLGGAMAAGSVAGVLVGAWLITRTPVPWLKVAFAAVMLFAAYRMWRPVRQTGGTFAAWIGVVLGVAAGLAGRLFGIGGGLVTVPVLVRLGVPPHRAVGSSLVPVFVTALVAAGLAFAGGADGWWAWGLVMGLGGLVGAPLGVAAAHRLHADRLRLVFAAGLVLAAAYIAATSGV